MGGDPPPPPAPAQAPAPRNLGQETRDTLQAEIDLAPQLYASEAQFRPQYSQLDAKILRDSLLGKEGGDPGLLQLFETQITPRTSAMEATAASAQREADIADVERLGPRAAAAFRAANPESSALIDQLTGEAQNVAPSELEQELNRQALEDLRLGGQLSPDEARAASQAARSAWADRGMAVGKPAIAAELLNRDAYANARKSQRQTFALDVDKYSNERQNMDRSFQGNVALLNQGNTRDPFLAILGRPSTASAVAQAQFQNSGFSLQSKPQLFDPFNPYAQDLYNTNYNGEAATNIANANQSAAVYGAGQARSGAMFGAGIGAVGAIGGAALIAA